MRIGIIGAGRLGLTFALLCKKAGYEVIVSDKREDYVFNLNNGICNTNEPLIQKMLFEVESFSATTSNIEIIKNSDIIFTFVSTPSIPDGSYDTSAVFEVANDFFEASKLDISIFNKKFVVGCTTNPGDCAQFQEKLQKYGWNVFYNPEFIAQGSIIKDLRRADMVLIGGKRGEVYDELCELYVKIQETTPKVSIMSTTAAELVKLAVNCYLTTKISYANMVGEVMTLAGLENEIQDVLTAIGDDTRVGSKYLKYGYGFGGPCLPRDNRSFAAYAKKLGLEYNLGATTDNFNNEHAKFLLEYFVKKNEKNLPFCFHYISYKEGTDILTESQQYRLCLDLLNRGYKVYVVEDYVKSQSDDRIIFGIPCEEVFWIEL